MLLRLHPALRALAVVTWVAGSGAACAKSHVAAGDAGRIGGDADAGPPTRDGGEGVDASSVLDASGCVRVEDCETTGGAGGDLVCGCASVEKSWQLPGADPLLAPGPNGFGVLATYPDSSVDALETTFFLVDRDGVPTAADPAVLGKFRAVDLVSVPGGYFAELTALSAEGMPTAFFAWFTSEGELRSGPTESGMQFSRSARIADSVIVVTVDSTEVWVLTVAGQLVGFGETPSGELTEIRRITSDSATGVFGMVGLAVTSWDDGAAIVYFLERNRSYCLHVIRVDERGRFVRDGEYGCTDEQPIQVDALAAGGTLLVAYQSAQLGDGPVLQPVHLMFLDDAGDEIAQDALTCGGPVLSYSLGASATSLAVGWVLVGSARVLLREYDLNGVAGPTLDAFEGGLRSPFGTAGIVVLIGRFWGENGRWSFAFGGVEGVFRSACSRAPD